MADRPTDVRLGDMAPDDAGSSPWERDDWMPVPPPDPSRPPRREEGGQPRRPPGRRALAAMAGVAAVAIGLAAVTAGSDEPPGSPPSASDGARSATTTAVPTPTTTFWTTSTVPGRVTVVVGVDAFRVLELDTIERGAPVRWTEWSIDVPDPLARVAVRTEVVIVTDSGTLHRMEFPSGRVRSASLGRAGTQAQLAVSQSTIAVNSLGRITTLSDSTPVAQFDLSPEGIEGVLARGGLDDFLVNGVRTSPDLPRQQWLIGSDGRRTDVSGGPFADIAAFEQAFVSTGALVANGPGGVYAIGLDDTRRLDVGEMNVVGANHVGVTRCDEALQCGRFVVDVATGTSVPARLDALGDPGYLDLTHRLSPDGRTAAIADWQATSAVWRLVDVATGDVVDTGVGIDRWATDPWAADSSGMFTVEGDELAFAALDGSTVRLDGLGSISALAVRATPDEVESATDPADEADADWIGSSGSTTVVVDPVSGLTPLADGAVPEWTDWSIDVPPLLAGPADAGAATEVVAVTTTGTIHRIEFPSGKVRSAQLDRADPGSELAVLGDTIAVSRYSEVVLVGDDAPVVSADLPSRRVGQIEARHGADDLLVIETGPTDTARRWLVGSDGSVDEITDGPWSAYLPWQQRFLDTGELVANAPGGVFAIGADGRSRLLDRGRLVASAGDRVVVGRCDVTLTCGSVRIGLVGGAETPVALGQTQRYLFQETATRLSPDGRYVLFADIWRGTASWRILDSDDGDVVDLDLVADIHTADSWAADSSGVFSVDGERIRFDSVDGESVSFSGFGTIRAIATR
jgi:hypothetical protein